MQRRNFLAAIATAWAATLLAKIPAKATPVNMARQPKIMLFDPTTNEYATFNLGPEPPTIFYDTRITDEGSHEYAWITPNNPTGQREVR